MHRMRRTLLAALAGLAGTAIVSARKRAAPAPSTRRSPRETPTTRSRALDPATRTITGSETITWRNITSTAAADLQFHLYWNAWRDARSTFMRERELGGPSDAHRAATRRRMGADGCHVDQADRPSPPTCTASKRFIAPDDGNPDDQTVMAVRPAAADRTRRHGDHRGRMDRARAAHRSPAPGPSATSSSSPSGSRSSASCRTRAGTAISFTRARSSSPTTASTTSR